MWNCSSNALSGSATPRKDFPPNQGTLDISDDEVSSPISRQEGLECPICWESFNIVENVPYVLWCGHTLCKNCVLGLQRAVLKFKNLPIQLPLFISCPWCHLLSLRLLYKGNLKFPRKNFFLLWMVESMNGERERSYSSFCADSQAAWPSTSMLTTGNNGYRPHESHRRVIEHLRHNHSQPILNQAGVLNVERIHSSLRKSLLFFVQLTAKFPLVLIFLLVLYAIPASAAILMMYILITVLFAVPSFLILYFAYPSLDWLVREIVN